MITHHIEAIARQLDEIESELQAASRTSQAYDHIQRDLGSLRERCNEVHKQALDLMGSARIREAGGS